MTEPTDRDREMAFAAITKDGKYPDVSVRTFDEEMLAKIIATAREEGRCEERKRMNYYEYHSRYNHYVS